MREVRRTGAGDGEVRTAAWALGSLGGVRGMVPVGCAQWGEGRERDRGGRGNR